MTQGSYGNFYGVTFAGGTNGNGTVFQPKPDGGFTTLHRFSAVDSNGFNSDGINPDGGLIEDGEGIFYGTTNVGGPAGKGTIYRVSVSPGIMSAATASAVVGKAFSYQITATNHPASYVV